MVRNRVGIGVRGAAKLGGPAIDVATTVVATVVATVADQFKSV